MKSTRLIIGAMAAIAAIFSSCNKADETIKDIICTVDPATLTLDKSTQDKTVSLTATRAWKAEITYEGDASDWLTLSATTGSASKSAQTITLTVKENSGRDRVAKVKFSIGLDDATLTVTQSGPGGSADPVYSNDFDKAAAVQTSSKWPYVYDTDCWKNEKGTGAASVTYITTNNKSSIRNNSNSTGSGVNNWFFGTSSRFCVKNITLPTGQTNYTVSFYGIRNVYGSTAGEGNSVFDHSQFKLYVSADGSKWVELAYAFEGGDPDATWGKASATFTVPSDTKTLCIGVPCPSETSTYRMDDIVLDIASAAGTAVDFTKGIEISEFEEGTVVDPTKAEAKTVKEFIEKADQNTYFKLTGTVSSFNSTYCSFDLTDDSGTIYVYSVTDESKTKYASVIKDGGTVTLAGKYGYYASKSQHEVLEAVIMEFKEGEPTPQGEAKGTGTETDPFNATAAIAKAKEIGSTASTEYYFIKGYVAAVTEISTQFGNGTFSITDTKEYNTEKFICYRVKYLGGTSFTSADQIKVGDEVVVKAQLVNYKGNTPETNDGQLVSINGKTDAGPQFGVESTAISVSSFSTEATIKVTGNVAWTATCDNPDFTLGTTSGTGAAEIRVTFSANTAETPRTANITVSTTAEVTAKSYTVVLTQAVAGASEYVLQTKKNSSNSAYANMYDVTVNGIDWKLPGNQALDDDATYGGKIKIGGKLSAATDRYLYSKAPIGGSLNKITFRHGKGDTQITVNSLKVSSYATATDAENGTNALDTKDVTYKDSDETSIDVSGDNWNGKYIRIVYNLSSTAASSNKGIILFYVKFAY